MKLDDILVDHIGQFGTYQRWLVFAISAVIGIMSAFNVMDIVFASIVPTFWCAPPQGWPVPDNLTIDDRINLTTPYTLKDGDPQPDACLSYDFPNISVTSESVAWQPSGNNTKACVFWEFDKLEYESTIISEVSVRVPTGIQIVVIKYSTLNPAFNVYSK